MQDLYKQVLHTVKKTLLVFFLTILLSFIVFADNLVEPYNDPLTVSLGNTLWCQLTGCNYTSTISAQDYLLWNGSSCCQGGASGVSAVTATSPIVSSGGTTPDISWNPINIVLGWFNLTNIPKQGNTTDEIWGVVDNGTFVKEGDINHSLDDAYDDGSVIQVDDTNVVWNMSAGKIFNVTNNLFSNNKNISNLVRSATFVVCANDSLDKTNCDYIADGIADEVEINDALDALSPIGGMVYLAEGNYTIDKSINISIENTVLTGTGDGSWIQLSDDSPNSTNVINLKTDGSKIMNLKIDGNQGNQPSTSTGSCIDAGRNVGTGIRPDNIKIINNRIFDCAEDGISIDGDFPIIYGNFIDLNNNGQYGIEIESNSQDHVISNNIFYRAPTGILVGKGRTSITSNMFRSNGNGIHVGNVQFVSIIGNQFNGITDVPIHFEADFGTISSNNIRIGDSCIVLSSANSNTITSNTLSACVKYIHLDSNDDTNIISNNVLDNTGYLTGATGIVIDEGSSEDNLVMTNIILNMTTPISDAGSGTILFNNIIGSSYINYNFNTERHEMIIDDVLEYWFGNEIANFTTNNLQVDQDTFYVDASLNRVGIGTESPSTELEVVGDITMSGNLTDGTSYIWHTGGDINLQLG